MKQIKLSTENTVAFTDFCIRSDAYARGVADAMQVAKVLFAETLGKPAVSADSPVTSDPE